jgi:hypothetical protein
MTGKEAAQLVLTVLKRTEEGQVPWSETASGDAFEASFPNQTIRIVRDEGIDDESGEPYTNYNLEVLNQKGTVVETVYPWNIRGTLPKSINAWELTTNVFQLARDQALGLDKTIKELFAELGGPIDIPQDPEPEPESEIPF